MGIFFRGPLKIRKTVLYFGPSLSGKSTNFGALPGSRQDDERLTLGVPDTHYLFYLYTDLKRALFYRPEKKNPIPFGGVVFVADSARGQLDNNRETLLALGRLLHEEGSDIAQVPVVLQYNKRDLPDATPLDEMDTWLRGVWPFEWPRVEAVASQGVGVRETIETLARLSARWQ